MATKNENTARDEKQGREDVADVTAEDKSEGDLLVADRTDEESTGDGDQLARTDKEVEDAADEDDGLAASEERTAPSGVGLGAGAVVSAGLAVVSLTGGWLGTVASARSSLEGQIKTAQGADAAKQIQAVYGDSWEVTALIAGVFAFAALVIGALVLARPAFGPPRPAPAAWIGSVAWGGVVLGVIGLLLAVAKYTDLLLPLPSAPGA